LQNASADLLGMSALVHRAGKQRMAHSLHPSPIPWQFAFILLEPQGDCCRHLRSSGRGSFAVETHELGTTESRPWDVRRIGRDGGLHGAIGAVVSLHCLETFEPAVGKVVGHGAAHGNDSTISGRINNMTDR